MEDFEQSQEGLENTSTQGGVADGAEASSPEQNLIDLDQVEKFRYKGEDWDRERLEKSMLMQADYTRKSQSFAKEKQEFAKQQKFYDNLAIDLASVAKNPSLVDKFKEIYPEKFHSYLKHYESFMGNPGTPNQGQTAGQPAKPTADPALLNRLEQVEGRFREQEIAAAEAQLDGVIKKYTEKYPYADENTVTTKAIALLDHLKSQGEGDRPLTERQWDALFKNEHERVKKMAEGRYKEEVKKQIQSNRAARDSASGGSPAGRSPEKRSFKQATEDAIRDMKGLGR
jgi:hypothetical protein